MRRYARGETATQLLLAERASFTSSVAPDEAKGSTP
jgi:hypothetical protein